MNKENDSTVLVAKDAWNSAVEGIKTLKYIAYYMPDCKLKALLQKDNLSRRAVQFSKMVEKVEKHEKIILIEGFIAILRLSLFGVLALERTEALKVVDFTLLGELFPDRSSTLTFDLVSSTLMLAIFNLTEAGRMIEQHTDVEVEFKKEETK